MEGRTLFVELENEPSLTRRKETFVALKGWARQLVGDVKVLWAPRWLICDPVRTRQVFAGIGSKTFGNRPLASR